MPSYPTFATEVKIKLQLHFFLIPMAGPVNSDTDCNCRKHVTLGKGIYTDLQMITFKSRMEPINLKTLFLLAASKIPCKKPDMNENEVKRL